MSFYPEHHYLCLECDEFISKDSVNKETRVCPSCGSGSIPADCDFTETITLTVQELRVILMWAEFHAVKIESQEYPARRIVYSIADRILPQVKTRLPLTFSQELADIRELFGEIQTTFPEPDE